MGDCEEVRKILDRFTTSRQYGYITTEDKEDIAQQICQLFPPYQDAQWSGKEGPCFWCDKLTHWLDICYEGYVCSAKCQQEIAQDVKTIRRHPQCNHKDKKCSNMEKQEGLNYGICLLRNPFDYLFEQKPDESDEGFRVLEGFLAGKPKPDESPLEGERECGFCGGKMVRNTHPDAGKPSKLLEVGIVYVCIPCERKACHNWAERAMKAEAECQKTYEALRGIAVLLANPLTTRQDKTKTMRLIRAVDEAWQLARQALEEGDEC